MHALQDTLETRGAYFDLNPTVDKLAKKQFDGEHLRQKIRGTLGKGFLQMKRQKTIQLFY